MPGQGIVSIGINQWSVSVATTPAEWSQGLSGIVSMPAGTGMLFDMGKDVVMDITTELMLFPIDVIWIHSTEGVKGVARNVPPGYTTNPTMGCRYFMEVNAGEASGVNIGDSVDIDIATGPSLSSIILSLVVPIVAIGMLSSVMKGTLMAQRELRVGDKVQILTGRDLMKIAIIEEVLEGPRTKAYIVRVHGDPYTQIYTAREIRALPEEWYEQYGRPPSELKHEVIPGMYGMLHRGTGGLEQQAASRMRDQYIYRGTEYRDKPYELEVDTGRGVIYLHEPMTGATVLRICRVPEEVTDTILGGGTGDLVLSYAVPRIGYVGGRVIRKSPVFLAFEDPEWIRIEDESGQVLLDVRGIPPGMSSGLRLGKFTDITVGVTGARSQLSPQAGSLAPVGKVEVAAVEGLVNSALLQKDRPSCLFCQRVETLIDPTTLTGTQQHNLERAHEVARELAGRNVPVKVASFDEPNILGATDGVIVYITPQRLSSWPRTLNTVAHETAHITTGKDDYSPVFQSKVKDLTARTLKFLQLASGDKEQLVKEYGAWAAGLAEKMVPPGDVGRARVLASRLVRELMIE